MKKILLLALVLGFGVSLMAQRAQLPENWRDISIKVDNPQLKVNDEASPNLGIMNPQNSRLAVDEEQIGETFYDLQTNSAIENRVYRYPDGTMAATWTMGMEATSFPDRGTGYNYYDGSEWGDAPTDRVEDERVGWPSYAGTEEGEIVVAHTGIDLKVSTRETKGTGEWNYSLFSGPDGHDILWPRITTTGNTVHMVANLPNITNGGEIYQGLDGALPYSRSLDGGETWETQNIILDGMTSDDYIGFSADDYTWASNGDVVALIVGSNFAGHDLFMMKSEDNGDTWEKTVIWENPYSDQIYDDIITEDTLWTPDGTVGADIDSEGNVHVAFGLSWVLKTETGPESGYNYFPFAEGIVYWNETMEPFEDENQHEALSYDNLVENETIVGWLPDVDGNGTIDIEETAQMYTYRPIGSSTMPTLQIDDEDNVFLFYATMREDLFSGEYYYRHIYGRGKLAGHSEWGTDHFDITGDEIHSFDECILPQAANILPGDESVYMMYNKDNTVGLALDEDHDYVSNGQIMVEISKSELLPVSNDNGIEVADKHNVSQNYPNPVTEIATIDVELNAKANVSFNIVNMVGQTVYTEDRGAVNAGTHQFKVNANDFETGIYFYNVNINGEKTTKKMVIK
jgi:hypothetical protein